MSQIKELPTVPKEFEQTFRRFSGMSPVQMEQQLGPDWRQMIQPYVGKTIDYHVVAGSDLILPREQFKSGQIFPPIQAESIGNTTE